MTEPQEEHSIPSKSPHPILIVDDEEGFSRMLARQLKKLGYASLQASSVEEGMKCNEANPVLAILLDLRFPEADGNMMLRKLSEAKNCPPVILMSGQVTMDDIIEGLRRGASDFLRKPFELDDLEKTLSRTLDSTGRINSRSVSERAQGAPSENAGLLPSPKKVSKPEPKQTSGVREEVIALSKRLVSGNISLPVVDPRLADFNAMMHKICSADDVVKAVKQDAALLANLVRAANSMFYRRRGAPVSTVRDAVVRLGVKQALGVVVEALAHNAFPALREPFKTIASKMWENMVVTARIAIKLGQRSGFSNTEELYLAALFHNLGELLVLQLFAELFDSRGQKVTKVETLAADIYKLHEPFGKALAENWKLPPSVIQIAGFHHRPAPEETAESRKLRNLVIASWYISLRAGYTYFPDQEGSDATMILAAVGLTEQEIEPLVQEAKGVFETS